MMHPFVVESVKKLWDTWNIRGLIILSLLVQSFLILCAPLRRQRRNTWLGISIWLAYLLADWVATFTIGLMLSAEVSDILAFWAPFLLLHLGGPDTITFFSLEDNEFWIRHLLGLMLQVGSTVYLVLQSLPDNKLWLPTLLVLIAGIIKYAERNRAFYLASFDHFKFKQNNPQERFEPDVGAMGIVKNLLVGPPLPPIRRNFNRDVFLKKEPKEVLPTLEVELSLLYEALHTKLPVVCCKIGCVLRVISLGCIFGALLSFGLITKNYQLGKFEIWLTYGLLIGAIILDFISIGFLIFSDFNLAFRKIPQCKIVGRINNRRRWSKKIPQFNFITHSVYFCNTPHWLDKLANFAPIGIVLDTIISIRCFSLRDFKEDKVWLFILEEVKKKAESAKTVEQGIQISLKRGDGILDSRREYRDLIWSVRNLDHMESLLTWHIATEVCFQFKEYDDDRPMSSENMGCREISKLISDYMLCVLMGPATTTNVPNFMRREELVKKAFDDLDSFSMDFVPFFSGNRIATEIFSKERKPGWLKPSVSGEKVSAFIFARILAFQLKQLRFPWKLMSQVWVEIMCYAAINCRPNVHAQQPGSGGQLLTFVWLLMNYLGLGSQFETEPDDIGDWNESTIPNDIGHGHEPTNPNELLLLLLCQRRSVEDSKFEYERGQISNL
ncbi:hypothetical protein SLA2020_238940 [Shorea laevis]